MKQLNFESEIKVAEKKNIIERFLEKINPKKFESMDWERWKRKNLNWNGAGRFLWAILRFIIIVGIAFMILYPFLVKLIVSFMSVNDISDNTVMYLPREGSTYFFQRAANNINYWSALFYTFLLSAIVAVAQLFVACFVGYGFARFKFVGSNLLFVIVILTLLIPAEVIKLPLYVRFNDLGMLNTFWPLTIMSFTGLGLKNGLYIYLMRQFFRGMPKELEMSAYIDGAGPFKTFFEIMLPNAFNMMITVFLFSFTWQWTDTTYNSMLMPDMTILSNTITNVTKGVTDLTQQGALIDTATLIVIAPLLIVFLFAQRYFIQGIERSGLVE